MIRPILILNFTVVNNNRGNKFTFLCKHTDFYISSLPSPRMAYRKNPLEEWTGT